MLSLNFRASWAFWKNVYSNCFTEISGQVKGSVTCIVHPLVINLTTLVLCLKLALADRSDDLYSEITAGEKRPATEPVSFSLIFLCAALSRSLPFSHLSFSGLFLSHFFGLMCNRNWIIPLNLNVSTKETAAALGWAYILKVVTWIAYWFKLCTI